MRARRDIADVLFNTATVLENAEDSAFRVRAYRRAARIVLAGSADEKTIETVMKLPLGPQLRLAIVEALRTASADGTS